MNGRIPELDDDGFDLNPALRYSDEDWFLPELPSVVSTLPSGILYSAFDWRPDENSAVSHTALPESLLPVLADEIDRALATAAVELVSRSEAREEKESSDEESSVEAAHDDEIESVVESDAAPHNKRKAFERTGDYDKDSPEAKLVALYPERTKRCKLSDAGEQTKLAKKAYLARAMRNMQKIYLSNLENSFLEHEAEIKKLNEIVAVQAAEIKVLSADKMVDVPAVQTEQTPSSSSYVGYSAGTSVAQVSRFGLLPMPQVVSGVSGEAVKKKREHSPTPR